MLLVPVVTPLSKYARGGVNRNGGGRSVTSAVPLRIAICDHKVSKLDLIRPIGTVQEDGIRNLLWLHRVPRPMMIRVRIASDESDETHKRLTGTFDNPMASLR